jgi:hypothetical protein
VQHVGRNALRLFASYGAVADSLPTRQIPCLENTGNFVANL